MHWKRPLVSPLWVRDAIGLEGFQESNGSLSSMNIRPMHEQSCGVSIMCMPWNQDAILKTASKVDSSIWRHELVQISYKMPMWSAHVWLFSFRVDLYMVIGKPIPLPRIAEPAAEDVQRYLDLFIDAMQGIYQRHQAEAGYPDSSLVVMWWHLPIPYFPTSEFWSLHKGGCLLFQ